MNSVMIQAKNKMVWMAEKVEYDNMITMRTFKLEVKAEGHFYRLVKNGSPWYYRAMQILSEYGLDKGLVLKEREILSENRNTAMSSCWKDSERPILKPMQVDYDSPEMILQRLEDYDIIEMGKVSK